MALATEDDIEVSMLRPLKETERQYAGQLLDRAESILISQIPDLLDKTSGDANFKSLVVAIEAEAVARVFRNPSAYKQESEGNYSYSLNYQAASGLIDILDKEWARLGQGDAGSLAPATDGYLQTRQGGRPDRAFQTEWPANNDWSNGGRFIL